MALFRNKQGDFEREEQAYQKAIKVDPGNPDAYAQYGDLLRTIPIRYPEAIRMYKKAYELDPLGNIGKRRLVNSLILSGRFEEAANLIETRIGERPTWAWGYRRLGGIYAWNLGRFDDGIFAQRKAVELDPTNPGFTRQLSGSYWQVGDMDKAIELQALEIVEGGVNENLRPLEAVLHAVAGDDRQALESMRRHLEAGGSPYWLMTQPPLKRFENHSEYQAMAERRMAELAVQLERIRTMEANGELPPIPELSAN